MTLYTCPTLFNYIQNIRNLYTCLDIVTIIKKLLKNLTTNNRPLSWKTCSLGIYTQHLTIYNSTKKNIKRKHVNIKTDHNIKCLFPTAKATNSDRVLSGLYSNNYQKYS